LTVNAGNGGFLHCIQMDTSVNAANQVVSVGADIAFDADPKFFACLVRLDRKSGSAGMPRPISYAVFCLKKKNTILSTILSSSHSSSVSTSSSFFFNDPASSEIYTLSLHDALPICLTVNAGNGGFLHCIQMDTSVNAANQVVSVGADIAFDADPKFFACLVR